MTKHVKCLKKTINQLESAHRRNTIISLSGGVISAAGGVTSIIGLMLAPVTCGASLAVAGVGVAVAAAGGITGVTSNITKMTCKKKYKEKIKEILNDCNSKLNPVVIQLHNNDYTLRCCQAEISAHMPIIDLTHRMKLASVSKQSSESIKVAEVNGKPPAMTTTRLSMILDVVSIASDVREMHEIRKRARGRRQSKSEMLMFINQLEDVAKELEIFCED